jgi:hypothetical protein
MQIGHGGKELSLFEQHIDFSKLFLGLENLC